MPVKRDQSGRRHVQAEVEVIGTPEEVWNAIATGPGISAWFVPTQVETDEHGKPAKVVSHFGPDPSMDAVATVTTWDPPRRFVAESPAERPNDPAVATEWTVEARSGGSCVVRVVHSWFASSDDWDSQFEGHEFGWAAFFRILRLYLRSFAGQPCSPFQSMAFTPEPPSRAWAILTQPLGLGDPTEGQRVTSPPDAPRLSGVVERVGAPEYPELLLRLEAPAPGIAHFFAMPMGGTTCVPVRLYLYGNQAAAVATREEPLWNAWIQQRFQPAGEAMS